jgi:hypothetical protein
MVVRDEADRYLECVFAALVPHVDVLHVYDDLSHDGSDLMALEAGAVVTRRTPLVRTFAEHEGIFRQTAWDAFAEAVRPCPGDWVLAIDADEVLIAPQGLSAAIDAAESEGAAAVSVPIPEAFERDDDGGMLVRTDGFWGGLSAPRLFRFRDGGAFRRVLMGCGSAPTYVHADPPATDNLGVQLLHLGYLDATDRKEKHDRYAGRPGHSAAHVSSILTRPTVTRWNGPRVDVWRGRR